MKIIDCRISWTFARSLISISVVLVSVGVMLMIPVPWPKDQTMTQLNGSLTAIRNDLQPFGLFAVELGLILPCVLVLSYLIALAMRATLVLLHRGGPARPGCFCKSCIKSIEEGKWPAPKNTGTQG
jgi:hypothetical protein